LKPAIVNTFRANIVKILLIILPCPTLSIGSICSFLNNYFSGNSRFLCSADRNSDFPYKALLDPEHRLPQIAQTHDYQAISLPVYMADEKHAFVTA